MIGLKCLFFQLTDRLEIEGTFPRNLTQLQVTTLSIIMIVTSDR